MDRQSSYALSVLAPDLDSQAYLRNEQLGELREFILDFRIDGAFIYRDQIQQNVLAKQYFCDVDIAHLISYNEELAHELTANPTELIPLFEQALKQCSHRVVFPNKNAAEFSLPEHQLLLHSSSAQTSIRDLDALQISQLVRIPGIVIGASTLSSKATIVHLECRNCGHSENMRVLGGFAGITLPRTCTRSKGPGETGDQCPLDPYYIVHDKCQFVDHQILKIQEAPDQVPVGELPRHMLVSADRYLTNRAIPGTRCIVNGIYTIYENKKGAKKGAAVAIRTPYLRAVGIHSTIDVTAKNGVEFTDEEEQEFLDMARRPDIYEAFVRSIAPSIFGNVNIKKAIACLLVGGSKKQLPDGMRLRGDINVLMLGDPGTAKSQLLKFVEKVAPIAIYTSGKGSSAAGLTATVQRDHTTREFYLEGGAMVLADNGVVCIDEFDKMRDEDRVAIHEAMEQQTISIAKAGITTILNARTAVLAAANPLFGRYDDFKTPGENIDFQTTILSRFDMIFIVKDEHDRARDERIAKHVMGVHMGKRDEELDEENNVNADIPVAKMRRYIQYCRSHCAPRLSAAAAEKLSAHFVSIRRQVAKSETAGGARSSIPITIRQLEAITRIAESLAKITLSNVATEQHVDEAIRLFLASTMDAVSHSGGRNAPTVKAVQQSISNGATGSGNSTTDGLNQLQITSAMQGDLMNETERMVEELRKRLPIGWSTSIGSLRREMCEQRGFSDGSLTRALNVLQRRGTLAIRNSAAVIHRVAL